MNIFSFSKYRLPIVFVIMSILLVVSMVPIFTHAQPAQPSDIPKELVTCGGEGEGFCGYCDLFTLAQNIINFLVFFATILAILIIVYVGFLYLTAGDNPAQITKAKSILIKVLVGFIVVLVAWLIVDLIMTSFLNKDFGPWNPPSCNVPSPNI